jgi:transcriptional regulator with XRE-family HTH domain
MRTLRQPAADSTMVLGKATVRAARALDMSNAALARVIGLSEPTISRIAHGAKGIDPKSKEGQLALLLIRVYRSLDPLVGSDPQKRMAWLNSHNNALHGKPVDLVETPDGLALTLSYLDGMRAAS